MQCPKCHYIWQPRVPKPRKCPNCKTMLEMAFREGLPAPSFEDEARVEERRGLTEHFSPYIPRPWELSEEELAKTEAEVAQTAVKQFRALVAAKKAQHENEIIDMAIRIINVCQILFIAVRCCLLANLLFNLLWIIHISAEMTSHHS